MSSRFDQCECGHLRGEHESSIEGPCLVKLENGDRVDCRCTEYHLLHERPWGMDHMRDTCPVCGESPIDCPGCAWNPPTKVN